MSAEIKIDHVLVASSILDTFYDKAIDTRFIFSVCVEPNTEKRESLVETLKALGRGQDAVVIGDYIFLRQTYANPEITCPKGADISLFHPVYQVFYSQSVSMHDKISVLDYHTYKCKLECLYDILDKLNTSYSPYKSLRDQLKEIFNMRSSILGSESILHNLDQTITITARSGQGKSWLW